MDPYLEAPVVWSDCHGRLASEISAVLNALVRPKYVARMTPTVTYDLIEISKAEVIRPDIGVWQTPAEAPGPGAGVETMATTVPVESLVLYEVPLELFTIELRTSDNLTLVTAIEILSPVNKRRGHDAFHAYLQKRRDPLRSTANLVEIDLLRVGERPPLEAPVPVAPYYVTVSRSRHRPRVAVWPVQFSDRLPTIPIPLREPDADVPLDLGAVLVAVYDHGGYDMLIDYHLPPPPPALSDAEATWLDGWLTQHGAR
jgi:hypothetical protein